MTEKHFPPGSDLLPCPFCGGKPTWQEIEGSQAVNFHPVYRINCSECFRIDMPWWSDKIDCIKQWNARTPVTPDIAQGAHMTVESIEAAFDKWRRTLTVVDRPSNQQIFSQGYVAGWNAKEAAAPQAAKELPLWQSLQLGMLLGKLSDWRNEDHEDALTLCRSDVIAILDGFKAKNTPPQAVVVTDRMCEIAVETDHSISRRIQGFTYEKRHVIRDVSLDPGKQEIWSAPVGTPHDYQAFQKQCEIERMRRVLEETLSRPEQG